MIQKTNPSTKGRHQQKGLVLLGRLHDERKLRLKQPTMVIKVKDQTHERQLIYLEYLANRGKMRTVRYHGWRQKHTAGEQTVTTDDAQNGETRCQADGHDLLLEDALPLMLIVAALHPKNAADLLLRSETLLLVSSRFVPVECADEVAMCLPSSSALPPNENRSNTHNRDNLTAACKRSRINFTMRDPNG